VTLNPIDGVEQKASSFWDHIHRKFSLLLKPDNPSEALPDRDSESLKNRFQRQIQKKMNVYNRYYKQVKECPPSGTTEEEWYKIAADNYRDAEGHSFAFLHCVEILHQLPKFNPMIDDADRSSDVVAEDSDADKKPAASVNKIGAPMGASLKRLQGSKKAKKELLLRDTSLSESTPAGALVMGRNADSHNVSILLHDSVRDNDVVEEQASNNSVGDVCEIMEQDRSVKKLPSVLEHTKSPFHIFPGSFLPRCVLLLFPGSGHFDSPDKSAVGGVDTIDKDKDFVELFLLDLERNHCSFSLKFMECPVKKSVHEWR
jgi:hypothetical protein